MRAPVALAALALSALVLAAPASARIPVYGVVPQDGALPDLADLDLMPAGGIDGIRMMAHWASVEKAPGEYDWSIIDGLVRQTTSRGITPLFFLYGTPAWAARSDGHRCRGEACSVFAPASRRTRKAFASFAREAVERYGPGGDFWEAPVGLRGAGAPAALGGSGRGLVPCLLPPLCPPAPPPPPPPEPDPPPSPTEPPCQCDEPRPIRTWQVWNEQNSPKYFAPRVNARRYGNILRNVNGAIKSADPGAEVVLGGMWGPRYLARRARAQDRKPPVVTFADYMKRLYRVRGIKPAFDSIAIHPYAVNVRRVLKQVREAHRLAERAGDRGAGVWITELGWASDGPKREPFVKGARGQARLLARTTRRLERRRRAFGVRAMFWYSWRDKPGGSAICSWCGYAGLRRADGSAKPAWDAFVRVAR